MADGSPGEEPKRKAIKPKLKLAPKPDPAAAADAALRLLQLEAEMRRCYQALGLDLTPAALSAMRDEMDRSASGHHRGHSEQLKRFQPTG